MFLLRAMFATKKTFAINCTEKRTLKVVWTTLNARDVHLTCSCWYGYSWISETRCVRKIRLDFSRYQSHCSFSPTFGVFSTFLFFPSNGRRSLVALNSDNRFPWGGQQQRATCFAWKHDILPPASIHPIKR